MGEGKKIWMTSAIYLSRKGRVCISHSLSHTHTQNVSQTHEWWCMKFRRPRIPPDFPSCCFPMRAREHLDFTGRRRLLPLLERPLRSAETRMLKPRAECVVRVISGRVRGEGGKKRKKGGEKNKKNPGEPDTKARSGRHPPPSSSTPRPSLTAPTQHALGAQRGSEWKERFGTKFGENERDEWSLVEGKGRAAGGRQGGSGGASLLAVMQIVNQG